MDSTRRSIGMLTCLNRGILLWTGAWILMVFILTSQVCYALKQCVLAIAILSVHHMAGSVKNSAS